jgi:hypothetical protein
MPFASSKPPVGTSSADRARPMSDRPCALAITRATAAPTSFRVAPRNADPRKYNAPTLRRRMEAS